MLSRIRQNDHSDIAVFDIDDVVDRDTITTDDDISDLLPLIHDGLDLHAVALAQHKEFPELWLAADTDDDYDIVNGVLSSVRPPYIHAPSYHRLILPTAYRHTVIDRTHKECGHLGHWKSYGSICMARNA